MKKTGVAGVALLFAVFASLGQVQAREEMVRVGAQVLVGGDRSTTLVIRNTGEKLEPFELNFFSNIYSQLAVSVDGSEERTSERDQLAPGEMRKVRLTRNSPPTTGWVTLEGNVQGEMVRSEGGFTYPATTITVLAREIVIPAVWDISDRSGQSEITGVALVNPNYWPIVWLSVVVEVIDDHGAVVARETITGAEALKPRHQTAWFIGEIFADNVNWGTYLRVVGPFRGKVVIREVGFDPNFLGLGYTALNVRF